MGNANGCLREPTKDEKGIIDLARGLFRDPEAIADSLVRKWCKDAVLGVTQLRNSGNLWVGFNNPSMEPHGAMPVLASHSPNGQPGMHIDDNVIENAITSAKWRRRLAVALLRETWHMWYGGTPLGGHPDGFYTNAFGEVVYRNQPYSEVNKCLK